MAYTLTGQYVHGNGAPRRGRIKLTPSVAIAGDDTVILPSPLTVDLDSGGSFSVPLVGTDDVAYSPSGWVWSCTEVLDGGRTFSFELTADSDIHTLTPVAVPDEYSYLMSDATPRDLGTAAAGTGLVASREDHVHGMPTAADVGASPVGHGHTLEDVSDAGGAAALDVGTTAGTVAAGDDARFTSQVSALALASPVSRYFAPPINTLSTYTPTLDALLLHPCLLSAGTLDRIGVNVATAGAAGAVVRLGLYADDSGAPGNLILDAGTIATDSTGVKEITISQAVTSGWYWLAAVSQTATATFTSGSILIGAQHVSTTATNIASYNYPRTVLLDALVDGALPSVPTIAADEWRTPRVFVRYA